MGAALLRRRLSDHNAAFPATPDTNGRVHEPSLWGYAVLCDEPVRRLCEGGALLPTGGLLLLAILLFHELHLDRGSGM